MFGPLCKLYIMPSFPLLFKEKIYCSFIHSWFQKYGPGKHPWQISGLCNASCIRWGDGLDWGGPSSVVVSLMGVGWSFVYMSGEGVFDYICQKKDKGLRVGLFVFV